MKNTNITLPEKFQNQIEKS